MPFQQHTLPWWGPLKLGTPPPAVAGVSGSLNRPWTSTPVGLSLMQWYQTIPTKKQTHESFLTNAVISNNNNNRHTILLNWRSDIKQYQQQTTNVTYLTDTCPRIENCKHTFSQALQSAKDFHKWTCGQPSLLVIQKSLCIKHSVENISLTNRRKNPVTSYKLNWWLLQIAFFVHLDTLTHFKRFPLS